MNEQTKNIAKAVGIHFEEDKQSRIHYINTDTLNKFAEAIAKNCIFEMVHESTWYSDKQLQDFTVDVTKRISEKFGIE